MILLWKMDSLQALSLALCHKSVLGVAWVTHFTVSCVAGTLVQSTPMTIQDNSQLLSVREGMPSPRLYGILFVYFCGTVDGNTLCVYFVLYTQNHVCKFFSLVLWLDSQSWQCLVVILSSIFRSCSECKACAPSCTFDHSPA